MSMLIHSEEFDAFISDFNRLDPLSLLPEEDVLSQDRCDEIVTNAQQSTNKLAVLIQSLQSTDAQLTEQFNHVRPLLDRLSPELIRLRHLKQLQLLLDDLQKIRDIHQQLQTCLDTVQSKRTTDQECKVFHMVDLYERLLSLWHELDPLSMDSSLKKYLKEVLLHWNRLVGQHLQPLFDQCLKLVNWPIISLVIEPRSSNHHHHHHQTIGSESLETFSKYFEALLKLETQHLTCRTDSLNKIHNNLNTCLPIERMLLPLKKRFAFHFFQESKTNRHDKPEWYLTQILTWIKNHDHFLETYVDPILKKSLNRYMPAKIQFMFELIQLLKLKLEQDLKAVLYDDRLFSHLFDEALLFSKELRSLFDGNGLFLITECNVIDLFDREPYFEQILLLEKQKSVSFIESLLTSESAWHSIHESTLDESADDLKVPECIDKFILVLDSINDRLSAFQSNDSKLAFVKLQLELLDDFRLRLAQLINNPDSKENFTKWPFSPKFFSIFNGINYIQIILEEWQLQSNFLELSEYGTGKSVFEDVLVLLRHLHNELVEKIVSSIIATVHQKLISYANLKWFCLTEDEEELNPTVHTDIVRPTSTPLSDSSLAMFYAIADALSILHSAIASNCFEVILRLITKQINDLLLEEVIFDCTFNEHGANRLDSDIHNGLIPLFKTYFDKPEQQFIELVEACSLLKLQRGTILLLKEIFETGTDRKVAVHALRDFNVFALTPERAYKVLKRKLI